MIVRPDALRLTVTAILALCASAAGAQSATPSSVNELEEIVVKGSQIQLPEAFAGGQVAQGGRAGILGNLDTLETPFSSTNYTQELIQDQQARSVADVLLNDPNVRVARGFGNFQELFIIRGFPAYSDDMTYNGVYGILPRQFVASEFLERVELFRGASAFLNGAAPGGSNLGGTVNLVPKRAPKEGITRLSVGFENDRAAYVAADVGRRFGDTGVRANLAYRDGDGSVDDQKRQLKVIGFGVDHAGDQLRLSADFGYQDHHIDAPRPSVTPIGGIPRPPKAEVNFAQPWTFTDEKQTFAVVRAEYDFTRSVSAWAAAGMRNGEEENVLANPNALADGSTTSFRFDNTREDDVYSMDAGIRFDFATGPVEHRIIASGSSFKIKSKNAFAFSNFFAPFASDLYNPVDAAPPPADFFLGGVLSDPLKTFETKTSSWALADMATLLDGKLIVTLGLRDQTIENDNFDFTSGALTSSYDESKTTPVGGVVFRPTENVSLYANYIQGLVAGDTAPTVGPPPDNRPIVNAGEVQKPYEADQFEAGIKFESDTLGASLAIFNVKKAFGVLSDATDNPGTPGLDLVYRDSGEQRHRGAEFGLYGQPTEHVRLIGGVTWLDAKFTKTQGGVGEGLRPIGAPKMQANANLEWDVPSYAGLTLEGRLMYTSKQFADAGNTLELDPWTRIDVGARYATKLGERPVTFRARIDNVADSKDWISAGGFPGFGYLVLGAPRTFVLSVSVDL